MLIINRLYIIFFLAVCVAGQSVAQISFVEESYKIDNKTIHSGVAMGFADLNGDALDDLIVLDDTRYMYVHFQTLGHTHRLIKNIGLLSFDDNWSLHVADVDGNGVQDIFTSGTGGMRIHMGEGILPEYIPKPINTPKFLSQGSNFADIDGDGDLDLFVCDDDAENFIAFNDGNGNFSEINRVMDFTTNPPSDGSGNYGSLWSDFDRDGDLDLYISKCRGGAGEGDPRRTNQFFLNTDTGFIRLNDHPELLTNDQSWTADFIDVENDGDWDLLVANHYAPMNLFIQQADGSFVDEAAARGIAFEGAVIQLISGDYDNDGDVDVFVPGADHILFENNGNGYFSNGNFPDGGNQIESATCGDLNNDGYLDIYAGYAQLFNTPSSIPDRLFMNKGSGNSFVKFSLRANSINKYAIGATIELYQKNKSQLREIRSGESYGINKSNIVHFGAGTDDEIDSVKVYWPSGSVEVHKSLLAGLTYQITEGGNVLPIFSDPIRADKKALCQDDTVTLTGPLNGNAYRWSTGDTTSSIHVTQPGVYTLSMSLFGEWLTLPAFQVMTEDFVESQIEIESGNLTKCQDAAVVLSSGDHDFSIEWNTGSQDPTLVVFDDGLYHFKATTNCGVSFSDTVEVINYMVDKPFIENDTVSQFESAMLSSSSDETIWVADTVVQDVIWTGQELLIDDLAKDSLVYAATLDTFMQEAIAAGIVSPDTMVDGYHINSANAKINFNALSDCILDEVTVFCRRSGPRTITIYNTNGIEVIRKKFNMNRGYNKLDLGARLYRNHSYDISTDSDENTFNFGFRSPDFMRSTAPVVYPFQNQLIEITGTDFPTQQYYYFYNWQVRPVDEVCLSYWVPAYAVVNGSVANDEQSKLIEPNIFPNPTRNSVNIYLDNSDTWEQIELFNENGLLISKLKVAQKLVHSIENLPSGLYIVKVINKWGNYNIQKVVVLE